MEEKLKQYLAQMEKTYILVQESAPLYASGALDVLFAIKSFIEENEGECEEYEEHRKSELLREIERNKEILKRDFGIEFE